MNDGFSRFGLLLEFELPQGGFSLYFFNEKSFFCDCSNHDIVFFRIFAPAFVFNND